MAELEKLVNARIDDFLRDIPRSIWQQLKEPMTWSEEIEGEEILFVVEILEKGPLQVNVGVLVQDPAGFHFGSNFFV